MDGGEVPLRPGDRIAHFEVLSELGRGGMGVVYLARDLTLRRTVALKVLPSSGDDPDRQRRLLREARAGAAVKHRNITTVFAVGEDRGRVFLAMEHAEGQTLRALLSSRALAVSEAVALARQVLAGLAAVHEAGLVHRDLKPDNVMIDANGTAQILDFGLAKRGAGEEAHIPETLASLISAEGQVIGTPAYMSPEQALGDPVDGRSDLFSFGTMFYEMLVGRRPFTGASRAALVRAVVGDTPRAPVQLRPEVGRALSDLVLQCLEKAPDRRPASVHAVEAALEEAPVGGGALRGRRALIAALGALVLAGLTALVVGRPPPLRPTAPAPVTSSTARRSVAVLGLANVSGREDTAWLGTALAEMLSTALAAGDRLRVVGGLRVAQAKAEVSVGDLSALDPDRLRRLASRLGVDVVILGSYVVVPGTPDPTVRLDVRLVDPRTSDTLSAATETATQRELLALVDRTGIQLRARLVVRERPADVAARVRAVLPTSPAAARAYAEGVAARRRFDLPLARERLEQAIALEPGFPQSFAELSRVLADLGDDERARTTAALAAERASALGPEDAREIQALSFARSGRWNEAIEVQTGLFEAYPDDVERGLELATTQISAGRSLDAVRTVGKLRALAPQDARLDLIEADARSSLGDNTAVIALGEAACAKAGGSKLLEARCVHIQAIAHLALGDHPRARQLAERAVAAFEAQGDAASGARSLLTMCGAQQQAGELAAAESTCTRALVLGERAGSDLPPISALQSVAWIRMLRGRLPGARQAAVEVRARIAKNPSVPRTYEAQRLLFDSTLAQYTGDLDGAKAMAEAAAVLFADLGDRAYEPWAQLFRSQLRRARSDYSGARADVDASARSAVGEARAAMFLTSGLLALDEGRADVAAEEARRAYQAYQQIGLLGYRALACQVLGRALRQRGDLAGARQALDEAIVLIRDSEDTGVVGEVNISAAALRVAEGAVEEGIAALDAQVQQLRRIGFVDLELEARLELGRAKLLARKPGAAAELATLATDARAIGFERIARLAQAARGR